MRYFFALIALLASTAAIAQANHLPADKETALHVVKPEYPFYARQRHWQGDGVFLLHIRRDGTVSSVDVLKSTGHRLLDESAVAAYRQWRFRPGHIGSYLRIPLSFTMQ